VLRLERTQARGRKSITGRRTQQKCWGFALCIGKRFSFRYKMRNGENFGRERQDCLGRDLEQITDEMGKQNKRVIS